MTRTDRVRATTYVGLAVISAVTVLPPAWIFLTSLKTGPEVYTYPPSLLPGTMYFGNYRQAIQEYGIGSAALNSLFVSSSATLLILIIGALAAYSHSKFRYIGNTTLFLLALLLRMVPPITVLIPLYNLGKSIGLINTLYWLVLVNVAFNLPTAIWIFKVFFDQLPQELFDAARIDGCGNAGIFARIVVPLSRGSIGVVTILMFVAVWNEFLMARTFAFGSEARMLPAALEPLLGVGVDVVGVHWGHVAAAATIIILPLVPIAVFFQRYLIAGMMGGAMKT
jgi:ABC-type glycerol-3-phosphate transport system permease component